MLQVTGIEDLKKASPYRVVELPPFPNGTPLVVKIQSPKLIDMMINGGIYNPLNEVVNEVIEGKAPKKNGKKVKPDPENQKSAMELIKKIAVSCLVEPTVAEIEEYAGGLTDMQIFAIYKEIESEVKVLSSFRGE